MANKPLLYKAKFQNYFNKGNQPGDTLFSKLKRSGYTPYLFQQRNQPDETLLSKPRDLTTTLDNHIRLEQPKSCDTLGIKHVCFVVAPHFSSIYGLILQRWPCIQCMVSPVPLFFAHFVGPKLHHHSPIFSPLPSNITFLTHSSNITFNPFSNCHSLFWKISDFAFFRPFK